MVVLIFVAFIILSISADLAVQFFRRRSIVKTIVTAEEKKALSLNSLLIPYDYYFDKSHSWAYAEREGNVKIGVDEFLLKVSGPLTGVEMKKSGDKIKKGSIAFSVIQNGKKLNIKAPISGTIKSNNEILQKDTKVFNSSPYEKAWVYIIEPSNWLRDSKFLIKTAKYREWLGYEISRLKDFLAISFQVKQQTSGNLILQDGGNLEERVLENLEPEVWEDFQEIFLNN